jgi:hypothetical protein
MLDENLMFLGECVGLLFTKFNLSMNIYPVFLIKSDAVRKIKFKSCKNTSCKAIQEVSLESNTFF